MQGSALLLALVIVVAVLGTSSAISFLLKTCRYANYGRHLMVALTLIPLSYHLCGILVYFSEAATALLHDRAARHRDALPPMAVQLLLAPQPLGKSVTLPDVIWMSCLFFVGYGVVVVWHLCIDIIRLLKASRRRMRLPDLKEVAKS